MQTKRRIFMAKGKAVAHTGPHKSHGPKRKMFHTMGNKVMRKAFADAGLLNKYNCEESFVLACQAKGLKYGTLSDWHARFNMFSLMKRTDQDAWLRACKDYKDPTAKKAK